jgi:uncharacterized membrane protein
MTDVSTKRHLAKTITWRIVGTIDTFILGWIITGDWMAGLSIGGAELLTKMVLYYAHERIWFKILFFKGRSKLRHILKTITWRFIGTIDTVILSWIITERADIGLTIGGLELITKMILYYLHERMWYRSKFGLPNEKAQNI